MRKEIQSQLDKILDETSGIYADVILQFRSERDVSLARLLEAAVATERNRAMTIEPANILPPHVSAFDGTRSARRKLRGREA